MKRINVIMLNFALLVIGMMLCIPGGTAIAASNGSISVDGSTTVGPIAKAFAEYYMGIHPDVNITISESGSGNGAKSLINGTCDIADMSRFMKDAEFEAAVANGVFPVAHVIALDGVAMIVHPANSVTALTSAQVHDIYTGKITNWSDVGGPNTRIVAISRDTNSGTYETFAKLVMNKDKMSSGVEYVGSNGGVRQRVQSTKGAIGYVGLGFLDSTVKGLKIDGIYPDAGTISSGIYPVARPLFMFTDGYPEMGSDVYKFVTMYLSPTGQEIINALGFIPVTQY